MRNAQLWWSVFLYLTYYMQLQADMSTKIGTLSHLS